MIILVLNKFLNSFYLPGGQTNDGVKYKKHYYFSKYFKSTWVEAKAICKSFDLELVTFETRVEAEFFFKKIATIYYFTNFDEKYVLVDGFSSTPKSTTDWYWTNSGLKVPYNMQWLEGEPNHTEGMENCLSIGRKMQNQKIGFNDIPCYKYSYKFVCQKTIMM